MGVFVGVAVEVDVAVGVRVGGTGVLVGVAVGMIGVGVGLGTIVSVKMLRMVGAAHIPATASTASTPIAMRNAPTVLHPIPLD
jgi:hypothetical protein